MLVHERFRAEFGVGHSDLGLSDQLSRRRLYPGLQVRFCRIFFTFPRDQDAEHFLLPEFEEVPPLGFACLW